MAHKAKGAPAKSKATKATGAKNAPKDKLAAKAQEAMAPREALVKPGRQNGGPAGITFQIAVVVMVVREKTVDAAYFISVAIIYTGANGVYSGPTSSGHPRQVRQLRNSAHRCHGCDP